MNIGFYDPISERWIKPRPPKEPEEKPCVSLGEALLNAVEAAAEKERCDRIWKITRQVAEGVNAPTASAPAVNADFDPVVNLQWDGSENWGTYTAPIVTDPNPPEYEVVESLGFVYWKPKETA